MTNKIIYVVDDDNEIREFLKNLLTDQGYKVHTYSNGIKFFEEIKIIRPNIILLDIMMSWLDGLNICSTLKNNNDYKDIPVILITAYKDKEIEEKIKKSKAEAYIYKPFNIEMFLNTIEKLI